MDKASDFESEDCAFESRRGLSVSFFKHLVSLRPSLIQQPIVHTGGPVA